MNKSEGQRDRTPGEAVHGLPMGGTKRIRTAGRTDWIDKEE